MHPSQSSFHHDPSAARSAYRAWPPFVACLFVVWCVSFLAITYQRYGISGSETSQWVRAFGLTAGAVFGQWELWRVVTYCGLHDGVGHLIVNVCCLLAPGFVVARAAGARRAILYAMAGALAGGAASALGGVFAPEQPILGGTAMASGLIAVYMVLRGDEPLFFIGEFAFPAWGAACVMLGASIYFAAQQSGWLGALQVFGAAGALAMLYVEPPMTRWWIRQHLRRLERQRIEESRMRERLDKLLDKIHNEGINGLSRSERMFLRKASEHFREREDAPK